MKIKLTTSDPFFERRHFSEIVIMNSMEADRLIIAHVHMEIFKSFYGKKVICDIHPQFSCIVGASGSGKSNLIGVRFFVFGDRTKWMRQSKLGDIIHKSSKYTNV
jgi:structural maintenance of chromosome 4